MAAETKIQRIVRALRDTHEASMLARAIVEAFPLALVDESDRPGVVSDFKLTLDENGRRK